MIRDHLKRLRYVHLAGFTAEEYELYELGRRSRPEAEEYISASQMWNLICPALNDGRYQRLTQDKWVFARFADSVGLPVPRTLGLFDPEVGRTWQGAPLRTGADLRRLLAAEPVRGLVAKPVTGYQGRGVLFCSVRGGPDPALVCREGPLSPEELAARLAPVGSEIAGGFLLQERLEQHPMLAEINPDTFNVLRVQTMSRADGSVAVEWAGVLFGRRGDVVPSLAVGPAHPSQARAGLCVPVTDLRTGMMGEGVVRPRYGGGRFHVHPDTGVDLGGRILPHWDQVLDVGRQGARALPWIRSVGWDIGLTPAGAVIVEANSTWNPVVVQSHGRGYLTPAFRRELAAVGVHSPQARPSIGQARRRVARRLRFALRRRLSADWERTSPGQMPTSGPGAGSAR